MRKKIWIGSGLAVAAIAWYAFRPELLFINKSVSETFPTRSVAANSSDAAAPKQLASGQFKGYAHETQGNAGIYDINGKRVLRLTDFKTSNGPDVHVYLVAASDAMDDATVKKAGFIDLGSMKGNMRIARKRSSTSMHTSASGSRWLEWRTRMAPSDSVATQRDLSWIQIASRTTWTTSTSLMRASFHHAAR